MSKLGTYDNPITVSGVPRAYKKCKCSRCGDISTCRPSHDFYTREMDAPKGTPLIGECCLYSEDSKVVVETPIPWRPYDPGK